MDRDHRLAGAELSAYRGAGKAAGQADPLPEVIAAVVDEIRGYVAACESNVLGAGNTIPDKLKSTALAMIRFRLISRLPLTVGEDRRQEYRDALDLLREVAACRFRVEEPTTPETVEHIAAPTPSITARTRTFTRELQDGT